jgi:AcrR family transcriptional regulator
LAGQLGGAVDRNGSAKVGRRNAEETRRKLMGATVASLYERGYGGLSTVDVAKRARVSRGGQLHHFPHKQELLAETVAHLFELRLAELHANIGKLPDATPEQRLAAFIDACWPAFKSRTFYAWLELVVASCTDRKLRQASSALIASFRDRGGATLFEAALGPSAARLALDCGMLARLVFGNLQALSLNHIAAGAGREDPPETAVGLESVKISSALFLRQMIDTAEKRAVAH